MADKAISGLTATTTVAAADLFLMENAGGNSRKITGANLLKGLSYHQIHFFGSVQVATTVNINSTTYAAFLPFVFFLDRDTFPATHYRLVFRAQSNAGGESIIAQLADAATATTPIHSGGNDLTISNTLQTHDSGWLSFDDGGSGLDLLCIALKGSNATVDLSVLYAEIMFKIQP